MDLRISALLDAYRSGATTPSAVARAVLAAAEAGDEPVWISRVPANALVARARELDGGDRDLPLYGIPFAVKDNIDVAGMPTTAGCPGFAYVPERSATVVERLLAAGAMFVGKTNMDQFATGLVGTRSPYGRCSSVFDSDRLSGGSSSGSALAVALGQASFALGTDTAGSGRVPAAFNELVGLKPTRGLVSNRGVVPACASLDCVSVFSSDVGGARVVLDVLGGLDADDPYSRVSTQQARPGGGRGRLAVPRAGQLSFTEAMAAVAWADALDRAGELFELVEVDVAPLLAAAPLLYKAWVAERTADLGRVIETAPAGLDPTVASIITGGASRSAVAVFEAEHELARLRRAAEPIWETADALLMPTVPGHPTHAELAGDPVGVNERLGSFTNFVNLLDLAAIAVPGPRRPDELPSGVTLLGPAFSDSTLATLAAVWLGEESAPEPARPAVELAVVGAHMTGLPLNFQLTNRGARLLGAVRTAPAYRLYALPGAVQRPGLVKALDDGRTIAAELWSLAPAALGELMTEVPGPLAIGRVTLDDGGEVAGFVCEGYAAALDGVEDITEFGGWRAYLESLATEVV